MADSEAVRAAFHQAEAAFGGVDVVFANAGVNGVAAPIQDLKPEEWDEVLTTNLKGAPSTWLLAALRDAAALG